MYTSLINMRDLQVNLKYLFGIMLIGNLSTMHFGFTLSLTNSCINALRHQLDWELDDDGKNPLLETIVGTASVLGLAVGCGLGGPLIKNGRKRIIIYISLLGIVGCGLSIVPNTWVLAVGRLVYGISSGILTIAGSTTVNEIIPKHLLEVGFSQCTNFMICVAILTSMALGLGMPDEFDIEGLKQTHFWQFVYGFPIIILVLSLYLNLVVHKQDTLSFHLENDQEKQAKAILEKIYPKEDEVMRQQVFNQLHTEIKVLKGSVKLSVAKVMFDPEYRKATWVCLFVAAANGLAAVNVLNVFVVTILQNI